MNTHHKRSRVTSPAQWSLQTKLTASFLTLSLFVLVSAHVMGRWTFVRAFDDYLTQLEERRLRHIAEHMGRVWAREGRWPPNTQELMLMRPPLVHPGGVPRTGLPPHWPPMRGRPPMRSGTPGGPPGASPGDFKVKGSKDDHDPGPHPTALYDAQGRWLAGSPALSSSGHHISAPVIVKGELVGVVRSAPEPEARGGLEAAFVNRQLSSSLWGAMITLLCATLFASRFSRRLLRPVTRLIKGIEALKAGRYDLRLPHQRGDELGALMCDVEQLAEILQSAQASRRELFADISHELRTPLAILQAELEALQDGVKPLNAESLRSLEEELERLHHLIDDLYQLSSADMGALLYRFAPCDLRALVLDTLEALPATQLTLHTSLEPVMASVDQRRFEQLLRNLLFNSLAYTDVPGRVEVTLSLTRPQHHPSHAPHHVTLTIQDSAPSVALDNCERLFEPLFRCEGSRSRRTAGSGLGLAISKKIVEAHGGDISASPSELGGLMISVTLPLLTPQESLKVRHHEPADD